VNPSWRSCDDVSIVCFVAQRHILDSQELIRVLTELQNQQRDLMNGHQRELQTMHKKQTQVQKQNDSSMKRTEQQGQYAYVCSRLFTSQ